MSVVSTYLQKAQKENQINNAFIRFHEDYVQKNLATFATRPLAAAPIGVKDLIMTQGYTTSCAAKILENYVPPYSATCFTKLEDA